MMAIENCPCGTHLPYAHCCGALHAGVRNADTAEELMRSRYTAYALKLPDYVVATTHPSSRTSDMMQQVEAWMQETTWLHLEVLNSIQGDPSDPAGEVEFRAEFTAGEAAGSHHERSRFERSENQWYYVEGVILET
ncbi:YchJ family protein [Planctomycetota bacterium]